MGGVEVTHCTTKDIRDALTELRAAGFTQHIVAEIVFRDDVDFRQEEYRLTIIERGKIIHGASGPSMAAIVANITKQKGAK